MRWPRMMARLGDHWVPRLLSGVEACFDLIGTTKRLLYVYCMRYVWSRAIHGPSVECVWRVDQVLSLFSAPANNRVVKIMCF
jgi:hypothetical protein